MHREISPRLGFIGRFCVWVVGGLWLMTALAVQGVQSVTLGWNASTAPGVTGYALYYGTASHNYSNRIDTGTNTQFTATGLKEGVTYYFAVAAYNAAWIESPHSAEIVYLVPGVLVAGRGSGSNSGGFLNMQFPVAPGRWYEIQASEDLKSWTNIWQMATATSNSWVTFQDPQYKSFPKRFYRLAGHVSSVLPAPIVQTETQSGANVTLAWNATPGQAYQVQYSADPSSGNWNNLGTAVAATTSTETASYLIGTGSQWSYRVVLTALPQPVFQSVARKNGRIMFSWNTVAGMVYQLQYTHNLNQSNWSNLGNAVTAFGSTMAASDAIGPDSQRFYRAVAIGSLPPPTIQSVSRSNGMIVFTWSSVSGQMYQVQYTRNLGQPNWNNLGNVITALGPTSTATDVIGPDSQRFYRVVHLTSSTSPVIQSVIQTNGMITLSWNTIPGQTYKMQYTSSLAQTNWSDLGSSITAPSFAMSASDVIGLDPQRFYRIVWMH